MPAELALAPWLVYAGVCLLVLVAALQCVLVLRRPPDPSAAVASLLDDAADRLGARVDAVERAMRLELAEQSRQNRVELGGAVDRSGVRLGQQVSTIATVQNNQIDGFAQQLSRLTEANEQRMGQMRERLLDDLRVNREELAAGLKQFGETLQRALGDLSAANEARIGEVRATLEARLQALQTENAARLDEMRRTVDEKLHATLEQRLGESFKLVSERLEQVHRGLGEMQTLASSVGDLKRVLGNVKTRGVWGEVQLAALLEQMLVPEQFAANVATVPGSNDRVEFAIRLPGRDASAPVWLPIDAKFPREDYERLMQAHDQADAGAAELASRQLEARLKAEARSIRDKYLAPPHTTDFALMFLPVEGLYAEAVRRPGLVDELQRVHRVVIAGPTTLSAILSSLQMGFRTLAVERRSSEVWQLLGAVKTEFGKFGGVLAKTKEQLDRASSTLGSYEVRTRAIERRLRDVESLPEEGARRVLADDGQPPHQMTHSTDPDHASSLGGASSPGDASSPVDASSPGDAASPGDASSARDVSAPSDASPSLHSHST